MRPIRIMVVDDHGMVREGLRLLLKEDGELKVVGEAGDGQHALELAAKVHPDVMLVDISMPGMDGIELCRRIQAQFPAIAVIILTTFLEGRLVEDCIKAGARGYVLKDVDQARLRDIIKTVALGGSVIDARILSQLTFKTSQSSEKDGEKPSHLSMQQITILKLISEGLSNKVIGAKLSLTENTVKSYVQDILQKLDAKNRAEAAMIALKNRWIQ